MLVAVTVSNGDDRSLCHCWTASGVFSPVPSLFISHCAYSLRFSRALSVVNGMTYVERIKITIPQTLAILLLSYNVPARQGRSEHMSNNPQWRINRIFQKLAKVPVGIFRPSLTNRFLHDCFKFAISQWKAIGPQCESNKGSRVFVPTCHTHVT